MYRSNMYKPLRLRRAEGEYSRRRGGLQERRQEAIPKAANNIGLVKQARGKRQVA